MTYCLDEFMVARLHERSGKPGEGVGLQGLAEERRVKDLEVVVLIYPFAVETVIPHHEIQRFPNTRSRKSVSESLRTVRKSHHGKAVCFRQGVVGAFWWCVVPSVFFHFLGVLLVDASDGGWVPWCAVGIVKFNLERPFPFLDPPRGVRVVAH